LTQLVNKSPKPRAPAFLHFGYLFDF
jgi:hypothetical protein